MDSTKSKSCHFYVYSCCHKNRSNIVLSFVVVVVVVFVFQFGVKSILDFPSSKRYQFYRNNSHSHHHIHFPVDEIIRDLPDHTRFAISSVP